jgi:hypothetical protein
VASAQTIGRPRGCCAGLLVQPQYAFAEMHDTMVSEFWQGCRDDSERAVHCARRSAICSQGHLQRECVAFAWQRAKRRSRFARQISSRIPARESRAIADARNRGRWECAEPSRHARIVRRDVRLHCWRFVVAALPRRGEQRRAMAGGLLAAGIGEQFSAGPAFDQRGRLHPITAFPPPGHRWRFSTTRLEVRPRING